MPVDTGYTSGQTNSRVSSRSVQAYLRVDSRELEVDRQMDRRVLRVVKLVPRVRNGH